MDMDVIVLNVLCNLFFSSSSCCLLPRDTDAMILTVLGMFFFSSSSYSGLATLGRRRRKINSLALSITGVTELQVHTKGEEEEKKKSRIRKESGANVN